MNKTAIPEKNHLQYKNAEIDTKKVNLNDLLRKLKRCNNERRLMDLLKQTMKKAGRLIVVLQFVNQLLENVRKALDVLVFPHLL